MSKLKLTLSYVSKMIVDPHLMDWFSKPNMVLQWEFGKKIMKKDECVSKDTYLEQQEMFQKFLTEIDEQILKAINCLKGKELKKSRTLRSNWEAR